MIQTFEVEEYHLAHAMREVAHEIRERQYDALSRLGALVDGPQGEDLGARISVACDRDEAAVVECMEELGWLKAHPHGG